MINFRDSTTESDLSKNIITLEFEFNPLTRLSTSLDYDLYLTWSQVNGTNPNSRRIRAVNCKNFRRYDARFSRVGETGTYRLSVPLVRLGEGSLLVWLSVRLSCIKYSNYRYSDSCSCSIWQMTGTSKSLEISARKG